MLEERFRGGSDRVRRELEQFMGTQTCAECTGGRLRPESQAVLIDDRNMPALTSIAIEEARDFFAALSFDSVRALIAEEALKEIRGRLQLMCDMGLGYLTLDRGAHTLSGGEAQRIRLASQIGLGLVGVMYVLDEPSYRPPLSRQPAPARYAQATPRHRQHRYRRRARRRDYARSRFDRRLWSRGGRARRNTGRLWPPRRDREKLGVHYRPLPGWPPTDTHPRPAAHGSGEWLEITDAKTPHHNLKGIDARIPLGCFTSVCGVSGSGKSSLINDILFKALNRQLHRAQVEAGLHGTIHGVEHLDKVIRIDQKPIGRTPRSNPATYTDVLTPIRQLFAKLPEARLRGYQQGRFSFNVKGGRCEACEGNGATLVEMEFLADVWVECEVCQGSGLTAKLRP